MINHFRSLALNVSSAGLPSPHTARSIHIDPNYSAVPLTQPLSELYSILYPSTDLDVKLWLAHSHMALMAGCGMTPAVTALDPRLTYDPMSSTAHMLPRAISVGVPLTDEAENPDVALRVFNYEYAPAWLDARMVRKINIEQQTNTNNLVILEDEAQIGVGTLSFSGGLSNVVTVLNPDNNKNRLFQFNIKYPSSPGFTSTSGKKWEVTLTAPPHELVPRLLSACLAKRSVVNRALASSKGHPSAESFDRVWESHFNENYKLAALHVSMVYRINALRG